MFDKASEKYEGILSRYYSLSKFKDVSDLDEVSILFSIYSSLIFQDLVQLYDNRVAYFEQYSDHVTKIKNFKETIDLLFLEKVNIYTIHVSNLIIR